MGLRGPKPRRKKIFWSADFAYAVGLMASDGNLRGDGLHFTLVSKDIEQIENIRKCFEITAKIGRHPSSRKNSKDIYYRVQWGDVVLYDYLMSIGLTPNKSLTIGALNIPEEYFFDYLRGSFDGDGCFYSYFDPRWKSSFMFYLSLASASFAHLEWVQETLYEAIRCSGRITRHKGKNHPLYQLRFAKKESTQLLAQMYPDRNVTCLSRKRLKIEKALGIVGLSLPRSKGT